MDISRKKMALIVVIIFLLFAATGNVLAQQDFVPLEAIPGITDQTDPGTFFNNIFKIGITIASFLAIIMIMIGGLQYMSTDKINDKEEGKDRITQAILGIILILLSVIILEIINPDILNLNLFRSIGN